MRVDIAKGDRVRVRVQLNTTVELAASDSNASWTRDGKEVTPVADGVYLIASVANGDLGKYVAADQHKQPVGEVRLERVPQVAWKRAGPNIAIGLLIVAAAWFAFSAGNEPTATALKEGQSQQQALEQECHFTAPPAPVDKEYPDIEVADAAAGDGIAVLVPRDGHARSSQSGPLAVKGDSKLTRGLALTTSVTELRRDDGLALPASQLLTRADVASNGREIIVRLCVSPRLGEIAAAGAYKGAVGLDDPMARGAKVPITVHVQYPNTIRALLFALLGALGGLVWTWLIRHADRAINPPEPDEPALQTLIIRIAALLAAVPVVVTIFFNDPDWSGTPSAYVALATASGGAVIAAAPTLRALASRIHQE